MVVVKVKKQKSMTDICHELAESLIRKHDFKTIPGIKIDEIYIYINGVYENYGRDAIRIEVEKRLGKLCKTHNVNEVINKIIRKTLVERNSMGCEDVNLICLENGVLNIDKMTLLPHNPSYRFMNKLPIFYDTAAKCPEIIEFFESILYEEDIKVMQEWIGYSLYRNYFIKKGLILVGGTDTGKTTCLSLIAKFIGEKNLSGISLQKLSSDKFSAAHLYNKYSNIYDDLSFTDVSDTGTFKMATGGGYISGEFKFGDQFQFRNFAKLIFATNRIPSTKVNEDDLAYYKRWIVFRFEEVFDDINKKTDKKLIDKMTTKKELSGLLNWVLIGLKRLLKNQKFSYSKNLEEVKRLIQRNSSDIAKFVQDCCIKGDETDWMSKQELYDHYKEYCNLNDLPIITDIELGRNITSFCYFMNDSRQGQKTGWRNIKIIDIKPIFGL